MTAEPWPDDQPKKRRTYERAICLFKTPELDELRKHGACKGLDPEVFFRSTRASKALRQLCAVCPVRDACAEHAIAHEEHGFWGGLTPNDRKKIRSQRRKAGLLPKRPPYQPIAPHGTESRARLERRRGGTPCLLCGHAEKQARQARRRRNNEPLVAEKRCVTCGVTKPADRFNRRADSTDGLQRDCRTCHRVSNTNWYNSTGRAQRGRT